MKVVISRSWHGFTLSPEAMVDLGSDCDWAYDRTDSKLISLLETKGSDYVSGGVCKLVIVDVPDNLIHWEIIEYDGMESIRASASPLYYFSGGE